MLTRWQNIGLNVWVGKVNINIKYRIWFEVEGKFILGYGGAQLLENIDKYRSISMAAKNLGLSYKFAWNYIRRIEKNIGKSIVYSTRGGARGGRTTLTKYGEKLLKKYYECINMINETIKNIYIEI